MRRTSITEIEKQKVLVLLRDSTQTFREIAGRIDCDPKVVSEINAEYGDIRKSHQVNRSTKVKKEKKIRTRFIVTKVKGGFL